MSITELFSHERYMAATCSGYTPEAVLNLLDRIEAEVTKTVSELEVQLDTVRDVRDLLNLRIAELKVQEPKTVRPTATHCAMPDEWDKYKCTCGMSVDTHENYCPNCGSKLNWR